MRKFISLVMMVAFSAAMFANTYWYRGGDNSWGATAMTVSTDGLYEYIQSSNNANQFKIAVSDDSWDYGWTYVQAGFNGTDVTNIGDYGQDNCYCWQSGAYYILVYYPNTAVNTTANPIVCASTTLPEAGAAAADGAIKLTFTYYNSTSGDGSAKLNTVAGIFDAACQAYVSEVNVGTDVYAGRKYKEGNDSIFSNLKLGTSSKAGELKFTLANPTEVDSIVFRAAMYANNEGGDGFSVNGTAFTLSAGKLLFEDKVWKPTGEVSSIDIVQTTANKGRFFLTSITIYPKAGDTPEQPEQPEVAKFYVTGNAALVGQDKEWNPAAIKSMNDTLVLDLEANIDYVLKVAVNGTWEGENNVKGYNELSEKTAGLLDLSDDHNIGFKLAEAGEVKVVYIAAEGENPEIFKLIGNFYVAPVEPTAKFYVTGNAALVGQDKEWNPAAIKSMNDTLVLNLEAEIDYVLKVAVNGTWEGENNVKGYNELSEKPEGLLDLGNDHNIGFRLAEAGEVKVVYIAAEGENPEIFKLIGNFYVAPVEPTAKFYVTGNAALVGQDKEWNPAAIKSMNDTLVLDLEANIDYVLKVAVNGTWEGENNVKGYNELSEKTAGLLDLSDDHNIGFKLAEAGEVKVVYIAAEGENPEIFKLIGNFYVAPVEPTAKFYVTGNAALVGQDKEWNPAAIKSMNDTLVLNLEADTDYILKVAVNGTWEGENNVKGYNELSEKTAGLLDLSDDHNIGFKLAEAGEVKVVYIAAEGENPEIFKLIGNFYVEPEPVYVLANGYYLVGKFGGVDAWSVEDLDADKLFAQNPDNANEYQLSINLAAGDEIKVVYVENDHIQDNGWYPAQGDNYVVDANHAGATTMYFQTTYKEEWAAFGGYFYIVPTGTVDITNVDANAQAVKAIRNGQLLIIKGEKTYNAQGTLVK